MFSTQFRGSHLPALVSAFSETVRLFVSGSLFLLPTLLSVLTIVKTEVSIIK